MNFKYFIMKLSCLVLSLAIAVSLVMFLFGISNVVMFQNRNITKSSIINHKALFVEDMSQCFDDMEDSFSIPTDALKFALNDNSIEVVAELVSNNFIYGYSTDFCDDEKLYNCFVSAIGQYCRENNIQTSEDEISNNSALAVTAVNKKLGGTATNNVSVYKLSKNKLLAIAIGGSAFLFIAAYFLLDFINYGRHRKYSYIGMGIITAGYTMVLEPLLVRKKGFVSTFNFCSVNLYNESIASLYSTIFKIFMIVGVALTIAGFIMLIINYRYFKKKGERAKAAHESSEQMKSEYLMQYKAKQNADGVKPTVNGERHVMPIDFDD